MYLYCQIESNISQRNVIFIQNMLYLHSKLLYMIYFDIMQSSLSWNTNAKEICDYKDTKNDMNRLLQHIQRL